MCQMWVVGFLFRTWRLSEVLDLLRKSFGAADLNDSIRSRSRESWAFSLVRHHSPQHCRWGSRSHREMQTWGLRTWSRTSVGEDAYTSDNGAVMLRSSFTLHLSGVLCSD